MTLQSCFQTSIFFSKGVNASFTLFSSMVAISLLHSKKAMFSYWWISAALIYLVHPGLLGILRGVYWGFLMLASVRNLLTIPAYPYKLSVPPTICGMTVLLLTNYYPYALSASKVFCDISAICMNSSSEFCSKIDFSWGLLSTTSVVWTLKPSSFVAIWLTWGLNPLEFIKALPRPAFELNFFLGMFFCFNR